VSIDINLLHIDEIIVSHKMIEIQGRQYLMVDCEETIDELLISNKNFAGEMCDSNKVQNTLFAIVPVRPHGAGNWLSCRRSRN
jgi:hypothetical protein